MVATLNTWGLLTVLPAALAGLLPAGQHVLNGVSETDNPIATAEFRCDLPPAVDPSKDGLPSANTLFSSRQALLKQVERHTAIVQVPSVSYDDLGDVWEDDRWLVFLKLHGVLEQHFPNV